MNRRFSRTALHRRLNRLGREWDSYHAKRPPLLYHYTDAAGLLGMLKTRHLWATNSRFMNDPTEMDFAARIVLETAEDQAVNYPTVLFNRVMREIKDFLKIYSPEQNDEYVSCFCENGDLLSQWRGYGALGGGYALGFDSQYIGLTHYQNLKKPEPVLRRVLYDQKQQKNLVGRFIRLLLDWETLRRKRYHKNIDIDSRDEAWDKFNWFLSECLNCFKDPAYSEEQEWRVIQYGRNMDSEKFVETQFRASRNRIVEYVELDFSRPTGKLRGQLPLKSIRYGPTLDPQVTERGLRLLCQQKGYGESVRIERSGVPFSG
jgi:Protein of unknown function (DUF2971)